MEPQSFPEFIEDEDTLTETLTRPSAPLIEYLKDLPSPLVILGAGGKMGPTLAVLARHAAQAAGIPLEIIAVSRYRDQQARQWLEKNGIKTLSLDLLDSEAYSQLPDAENVIYLVGLKFGTSQNPINTWVMNTLVPAYTAQRYHSARIVALSTGNVYPLVPVTSSGSVEEDPMEPIGEYGNACMARERVFEYFSIRQGTRLVLIRLNYALDLRYGVLVDIAQKIHFGEAVNVTTGSLNCIWQGDANDMIIRSLAYAASPPKVLNLTYPRVFSIRELTLQLSDLLGKEAIITGKEVDSAFLSNPAEICRLLGDPPTPIPTVLRWTAHWVQNGGRLLNKPTHFEVRDGKY